MTIRSLLAGVVVGGGLCGVAFAVEVQIPFDAGTSASFDVSATLNGTTLSDSASTGITGFITVDIDAATPTQISLVDFSGTTTSNLNFDLTVFLLGGATVLIPAPAVATYATPGTPTGPVPVSGGGTFAFPLVEVNLAGTAMVQGVGLLGGSVTDETIQLSDFNPFEGSFGGTVTVVGDTVFLSSTIDVSGMSDPTMDPVITTTSMITLTGSRPIVFPSACPCDLVAPDGTVDVLDLLEFLGFWFASDPAANINGDNLVDVLDLLEFLGCWFPASGRGAVPVSRPCPTD